MILCQYIINQYRVQITEASTSLGMVIEILINDDIFTF